MSMFLTVLKKELDKYMNKEREKEILKLLLARKEITVNELSEQLFTSESSIRRDLKSLEKQQLIKRVHGGAVIEENSISTLKIPFVIRELEQSDAKIKMAKEAINYINDYDVIFLDASSSAYNLIPFLAVKNHLTVITSGIKALLKLGEYGIKAISTGGELLPSCQSLVGEEAYKTIEAYNANAVFFSCRGLSDDGFLTDISDSENHVRRRMIENSQKSYLMCASDKIGKKYFHNLCSAGDISKIICDKEICKSDFLIGGKR